LRGIREYLKGTIELLETVSQPAIDRLGLTAERVREAGDAYVAHVRQIDN
jgi:hypothetical protein